jgi:hypothetical protein
VHKNNLILECLDASIAAMAGALPSIRSGSNPSSRSDVESR